MSLYHIASDLKPSDFFSQAEEWQHQIESLQEMVESALASEPRDAPISETALRSFIGKGHAFAHIEDLKHIVRRPIKQDYILGTSAANSLNGYVEAAIRNAPSRLMYHLLDGDKRRMGITISLGDLQREAGYKLISQEVWQYVMANYSFPSFMNVINHNNHAWTLWWYAHQMGVGGDSPL